MRSRRVQGKLRAESELEAVKKRLRARACAEEHHAIRLLGVSIHPLHLTALLRQIERGIRERARLTVLYVNVHCMNVAHLDPTYARILDAASAVYCDGTGVRLAARLAGLRVPERVTGADWIHDLCRLAIREDLSLYFLGSEAGSAEGAARALSVRYPGLRVTGARPGFAVGQEVVDDVNRTAPDILLVGMGTPTQEKWIAAHRTELDVPVVWAVGALFDFVSGKIPRGPRWMTDHGLEWVCRLVVEPRKLWRRYLVGNPLFFYRVLRCYGPVGHGISRQR